MPDEKEMLKKFGQISEIDQFFCVRLLEKVVSLSPEEASKYIRGAATHIDEIRELIEKSWKIYINTGGLCPAFYPMVFGMDLKKIVAPWGVQEV